MNLASLRQQVGQLLVIGFEGSSLTAATESLLKELQPAGLILFARNIESAQQTHALLSACRKMISVAPFLCVDMEGGTVDRLKNALAPAPSAAAVVASGSKARFAQHGKLIGAACRTLGFNLDFAPTLDLALPASRSVLGSRAVSSDARRVAAYARLFLRGLRSAGVLGCGKHFPGLGEAPLDTHQQLPSIYKSWEGLWEQDMAPYRLLRHELPFVMVGHANYPALTGDKLPASMSPKCIAEILRGKIGYRGLVISDDMEMGAALASGSIEHAAIESIRAGADLVLISHQEHLIRGAHEAVLREAEGTPAFASRVAEGATHVLGFKHRLKALRNVPLRPSEAIIRKLRRQIGEFAAQIEVRA